MEVAPPIVAILGSIGTVWLLALTACAVLLIRRSAPAQLERRQNAVERTCSHLGTQLDDVVAQRAAWKAQGESLVEEVSGYFERIERKRASASSAASRAERLEAQRGPVDISALPRSEQIRLARAAGG